MHKIMYWIGVYATCVFIHDGLDYCVDKYEHEKKHKKEPIGIKPDPARKPINKIGFVVNSD